ncbi:MAG: energy transducer TonB [Bacteroidetes bacterium]|nr:energy transducer TonB [Bacteroidota bacterium]
MKTDLILKSDILDIIFENRNKDYGAYSLRKLYQSRLLKSIVITVSAVLLLSAFTFLHKNGPGNNKLIISASDTIVLPPKENKIVPPEPPEPPVEPPKPISTLKLPSRIVMTEHPVDTLPEDKPDITISDITNIIPDDKGSDIIRPADKGDGGKGVTPAPAKPEINPNIPSATADVMPEFPGGVEALKKFLQRNLSNPRDMEENEVVSVKIRFVVGYDGKLKSFETVQNGGEDFNKEVIRVLKKMPDWTPGKTSGQNVSVYYTLPVKFVAGN